MTLAATPATSSQPSNYGAVEHYYSMAETRLDFGFLTGGTRHYGLYQPGDWAWNWSAAMRRMEDKLAADLAPVPGDHVLDAGCGVGDVALRLAATWGCRVLGVDILGSCIDQARRRARRGGLAGQAEFRQASFDSLDIADGTFDGAYTLETLIHAPDPAAVLSELHRVLRPGGRIVLIEYAHAPEQDMPPAAAAAFREINEAASMPGNARFEYGYVERELRQAGFTGVTTEDLTAQMLPMARCFARMARIPYEVARLFRCTDKIINSTAAVKFWRYRSYYRYQIYTARR